MTKSNRYRNWKVNYDLRHKREKKIYLLKLGLALFLILLLYFWYTGRLKFFAQPTSHVTGVVTDVQPWRTGTNSGLGVYIQYADYIYTIDGVEYSEGFFPDRTIGRLHKGDSVKVKYSEFFNSLSEVVEVTYCNKKDRN